MKRTTLLFCALFCTLFAVSVSSFSQARLPDDTIFMKGSVGALPSSSVNVVLTWNKTVVTTFTQKVDNVTVTVRNIKGDILETQTLDADEYETVVIDLRNRYKEGENIIEIRSPEGVLEGRF